MICFPIDIQFKKGERWIFIISTKFSFKNILNKFDIHKYKIGKGLTWYLNKKNKK